MERVFYSRKILDKSKDPYEFVDEELPTVSVQLKVTRTGRFRAPHGTVIGSYRLSGTYQGTYNLRVTRVSIASGSPGVWWHIAHSRKGTYDMIYFPTSGQAQLLGGPNDPIYAFGPGTVKWGFLEAGSAYWMSQHLEGLAS